MEDFILKKILYVFFLMIFILAGCGTSWNSAKNGTNGSNISSSELQVDDFVIGIHVEKQYPLQVYATITYTGNDEEIDIYHGGSIFFFNIYNQNGDFEYEGAMEQPLLTTTLKQNQAHQVDMDLSHVNLKPGTYEFEAIAEFFLDQDDWAGTNYNIPVKVVVDIE